MTASRYPRTGAVVLVTVSAVVILELLSLLGIWSISRLTGTPIRRKAAIYAEQSEQIRWLLQPTPARREQIDPLLGWKYRAPFARDEEIINAQGARSVQTYQPVAAAGVLRIAAFGGSFVYGEGVGTRQAWPTRMEALFDRLEVLNYGVGGYGVDQAFLRYHQDGHTLAPQVVVVGVAAEDLRRVVNTYRPFIADTEPPLAKPRFVLEADGALTLLPPPLPDRAAYERLLADPSSVSALGEHDHWYEPAIHENPLYDHLASARLASTVWLRLQDRWFDSDTPISDGTLNTRSEAYQLQAALLERLGGDIRQAGARPHVVLFPDRYSLTAQLAGRAAMHAPLAADLQRLGIPYSDLSPAFREAARSDGIEALFLAGGHYSAAGNDVAARAIGIALGARPAG